MSIGVVQITKDKIYIAADNQISYDQNRFVDREQSFAPCKIVRNEHVAFVSAGVLGVCVLFDIYSRSNKFLNDTDIDIMNYMVNFYQWLGSKDSSLSGTKNQFILVIGGKVFDVEGIMVREVKKYSAIGSGTFLALGAMRMGATALEAVETAIEFDLYCGGSPVSLEIERKPV